MKAFFDDLRYSKEIMFHPFDAFYEMKFRSRGNIFVATLFYFLFGIVAIVHIQFGGFIVTFVKISELNSLFVFSGVIVPYLLFAVGNYSITTLMDGKGRFSEIYNTIGYSLLPNIIFILSATIVSNFITSDEIEFYTLFLVIGNGLTLFLIFVGLIVTHEYSFFRSVISIILSFVAVALIVFVLLLMITLFSQVYGFIKIVIMELRN